MSNYKGHISGGCVAFAMMLLLVVPMHHPSVFTMIEWYLFTIAGSLFPDVDIKSKGQYYFYLIMLLLFVVLAMGNHFKHIAVISMLSTLPLLVKHRGIFHRLWFVIAAPLVIWYVLSIQFPTLYSVLLLDTLFFIAGAISHLWLDMGMRMIRL